MACGRRGEGDGEEGDGVGLGCNGAEEGEERPVYRLPSRLHEERSESCSAWRGGEGVVRLVGVSRRRWQREDVRADKLKDRYLRVGMVDPHHVEEAVIVEQAAKGPVKTCGTEHHLDQVLDV
jgi:hypothetical protein